jgi:hypothetical protein
VLSEYCTLFKMIKYGPGPWVTVVSALLFFLCSVQPKFSQVTTGCGTSHLKYKIYGMSKTQEYFLGCYAMFSDKFDVHGTVHHYCIS